MIDLLNYETFFLLYADGELSPSEQESVLQFVAQHPLLEAEFNRIKALKFSPDKGLVMMDKSALRMEIPEETEADYSFEPDLSIVYPNKAELYRKEKVLPVYWLRMVGVAAALLFTLGIAWMVMGEKDNNPSIAMDKGLVPTSSSTGTPTLPNPNKANASSENKMLASTDNLPLQVDRSVGSTANPLTVSNTNGTEFKNPSQQATVVLEPTTDISTAQVVVPDVPVVSSPQQISVKPKANFSEAVLLAAAERMATAAMPIASELNTGLLINAAMKEEKKSGLRSIIRTINRRLLDEQEFPQDQKFIQVANFYIPVNK